jgi:hypothetical protein
MNIRHYLPALVIGALALAFPPATEAQLSSPREAVAKENDPPPLGIERPHHVLATTI